MEISWYGSRCVRVQAKDGSLLIDPFDPKEVDLRAPSTSDDIVLVSSAVVSSDVIDRAGDAFIIKGPGEYERKGIAIRGIGAFQDSQNGSELGRCTIYKIIADEISLCHLGALGQEKLTPEQLETIGDPDILFIPASGQGALDAKVAAEIANQIEPKIIIPIGFESSPDKFLKEIGLPAEKMESFKISPKQLPVDRTMVVVLTK